MSRRVAHPTAAEPGDEAVYRAADPLPDEGDGTAAGRPGAGEASADEAAAETAAEDDSEPTRSE